MPSMLWHCWLGIGNSIWSVKIEWWGVGVVICLVWGADCLHMVHVMPLHPKTLSSLALFISRLVLPFWYQLTQIVPEKRLLTGCSRIVVISFLISESSCRGTMTTFISVGSRKIIPVGDLAWFALVLLSYLRYCDTVIWVAGRIRDK